MAKRLILVFAVMLLSSCTVFQPSGAKTWLTVPMSRFGQYMVVIGPDLSPEVGQVYTYYSHGEWIALSWLGYHFGVNVWQIPTQLMVMHPDWQQNRSWSVDFPGWLNIWKFFGAKVGTTAH